MNEQEKSQETVDQKPSPKKKKRCFLAAILPWKGDRFGAVSYTHLSLFAGSFILAGETARQRQGGPA